MATVAAPATDWSATPPSPTGAVNIVQSTGYYPVGATVQWNSGTNLQSVLPAPGFQDLVNAPGAGASQ